MRVPSSIFGCLVFAACASSAFGQVSFFVSEPVLGTPILLGVDENQPGSTTVEFKDPVLGSVIMIAATSDRDSHQITNASGSTANTRAPIRTAGNPPREIHSKEQNHCELSIHGQGYFQIQLPDGQFRYTRQGSFRLDSDRRLTTSDGHLLFPVVKIPANAELVTIDSNGSISISTPGQPSAADLKTTVSIVRFENPKGLSTTDQVYFAETKESGAPIVGTPGSTGFGTLRQRTDSPAKTNALAELILWVITR